MAQIGKPAGAIPDQLWGHIQHFDIWNISDGGCCAPAHAITN